MAANPEELNIDAEGRRNAYYYISNRDFLGARLQDWHDEIRRFDLITDDRFAEVFPAKYSAEAKEAVLQVQNLVTDALMDATRLAAESFPTVEVTTIGRALADTEQAALRAAIGAGYGLANNDSDEQEEFVLDLIGAGGAFTLHTIDKDKDGNLLFDYPRHRRLNPRACLPNITGKHLTDLYYTMLMPLNTVGEEFPELKEDIERLDFVEGSQAEVIDYFGCYETVRCVRVQINELMNRKKITSSRGWVIYRWDNPLGRPPVSWSKSPNFRGTWRGYLNQMAQVNNTVNRIYSLLLDVSEKAAYAPLVGKGLLNPEADGPNAYLELATDVDGALVQRLPPAPIPGGLVALAGQLADQARGSGAFPQQRQGEPGGSIVSAAGIQASAGQQTSFVRSIQRRYAMMIRRGIELDIALDQQPELNFEKRLLVGAGQNKTYVPKKDIGEGWRVTVRYGMGSGLGPVNQAQLVMQEFGNGLLSKETAIEHLPDVPNPTAEMDRRYAEDSIAMLAQRFQATTTPEAGLAFGKMMQKGSRILDALVAGIEAEVAAAQAAQQAAQQQQQPGAPPGISAGQPNVPQQAAALAAGGVPGTAPSLPTPALPPGLPDLASVLAPGAPPQPLPQPFTQNIGRT